MEDQRKQIRPTVPVVVYEESSTAEKFQNMVLRPILKMQHHLLLAIFHYFMGKRKVPFTTFSNRKQLQWISDSCTKDQRMRSMLIGAVTGHFTLEEWNTFLQEDKEITRRIMQLIIQRLQSEMKEEQ